MAAEETDVLLQLFSEWYGIPPHWKCLADVKGQAFEQLWTSLWFAKGQLTAPLDAHLREKYASAFSLVDPYRASGIPQPPETLPPLFRRMWSIAAIILCDQISRNVFRNSARAYATDLLARRLIAPFLLDFDLLPVPVCVSIVLVLIHSENSLDWGISPPPNQGTSFDLVAAYVERLKPRLENECDFVFQSLRRIAQNHRDRMQLFGRIPERNQFLGRESCEREIAYMKAMES
jgi:uncharacterized protein (DUF924 family)